MLNFFSGEDDSFFFYLYLFDYDRSKDSKQSSWKLQLCVFNETLTRGVEPEESNFAPSYVPNINDNLKFSKRVR